jgi:hypothetical protein
MGDEFEKINRYETAKQRLQTLILRCFHPNLAAHTDLDGLEGAVDGIEKLIDVSVENHTRSLRAGEVAAEAGVETKVEENPPPPPPAGGRRGGSQRKKAAE